MKTYVEIGQGTRASVVGYVSDRYSVKDKLQPIILENITFAHAQHHFVNGIDIGMMR